MALLKPAALAAMLMVSFPCAAADLSGLVGAGCGVTGQSSLHLLARADIDERVSAYYDEASLALDDVSVVGSRSPAFVWARETKFQCGKAIGYLEGGTVDEVSIENCDCFHSRYQKFR